MARGAVEEFRTRASRPAEVLKQRIKQAQQRFRRTFQRKAFLSEPDRSLSRFRKTSNGALITATLHGVPVEGAYDEVSAVPLMHGRSQEGVILSTRGSRNFEPSSKCGTSSMSSGSSGSRWTPPSIPELANLEPREALAAMLARLEGPVPTFRPTEEMRRAVKAWKYVHEEQ